MKISWRKATISLDQRHVAEVAAENAGEQRVYLWAVRPADREDEILQWGHEHSFEAALHAAQERLRNLFLQSFQGQAIRAA
jgi:hypothetical protein